METEQYFKSDAKTTVDTLFDAKLFKDEVTRDMLNGVEEYIAFVMQTRFSSYQRVTKLMERVEANKKAIN